MEIISGKDFRRVRGLPFCYLCGRRFNDVNDKTRDHVPPQTMFLSADRRNPLILPTHNKCNQGESWADEIVGQLIGVLHGKYPQRKNLKVKVGLYTSNKDNQPALVLEGINFRGFIARCVKAFHAALYREFLPPTTPNWFDPPIIPGVKKQGKVEFEETRVQFPLIVSTIKKNRKAGKIDRISCFNNKCIYECVWEQMDNGQWACMFALNIYDWKRLGDSSHQPIRGCVGFYMPTKGLPKNATTGIVKILEIPISNTEPLDPFAS